MKLSSALFALPPAEAHAFAVWCLGALEQSAWLRERMAFRTEPAWGVDALGLHFAHPLGLAGGFDKNAERPRALAALGFSFLELGTVTADAQEANPAPNLFRLREDHALVNRLGFPNLGARAVAARLLPKPVNIPIAMSIGKSRRVAADDLEAVCEDYAASFDAVLPVSDFVVVNVSSPNTQGLRGLQSSEVARRIFRTLMQRNTPDASALQKSATPVLVKVAPDLSMADLDALVDAALTEGLSGVVATNTTLSREGLKTRADHVTSMGAGGLSGRPLFARSLAMVRHLRERVGNKATLIGVGGIEGREQMLAYLDAGATLVQAYTGFVYGGPGFVRACVEPKELQR
jgi:dihydroorotate dehydrogenase